MADASILTTADPSCSLCGRGGRPVVKAGPETEAVSLCGECLDELRLKLDRQPSPVPERVQIRHLYRMHFQDPRRERQFLASLSFFVTFALVRLIVRSIRSGKGPFHNVSAGGRHIHHLVWGILLLLVIGFVWLLQLGTGVLRPRKWMRATAVFYGMGSALTLDEFALWLNLSDVYFTPEGRESVDAIILFGSVLSIGFWGRPFLHALTKHLIRKTMATAA